MVVERLLYLSAAEHTIDCVRRTVFCTTFHPILIDFSSVPMEGNSAAILAVCNYAVRNIACMP